MVLLISYDLNGHERPSAYARVKEIIEEKAIDSIKPLYSQWFVETNETPKFWTDLLTEDALDKGDKLFVIRVQQPYNGWLKDEYWDWIRARR